VELILKDLKAITRRTGVHIDLICHPHKMRENNPVVGPNDLKGSSAIDKMADNGITVWRRKITDGKAGGAPQAKGWMPDTVSLLFVWKCRSDAGNEGMVVLDFDPQTTGYRTITDDEKRKLRTRKKKPGGGGQGLPLNAPERPQNEDYFD